MRRTVSKMQYKIAFALLVSCLCGMVNTAQAITVFTCEPEWAALTKELAPKAKVFSATHVFQDPHYIEARPSLISRLAKADLAICSGAELESGWLPVLQKRAGNRNVLKHAVGMLYLSKYVKTIDKHHKQFFSTDHVHPEGNPHFHLDPEAIPKLATVISRRMQKIDPDSREDYQKALDDWQRRWKVAQVKWEKAAQGLNGTPIVVQHSSFSYLLNWLGMNAVGDLEPEPGVPPTLAHAQSLIMTTSATPPVAILTNWYQNDRAAKWMSEKTGAVHLNLPGTVDLDGEINTLQKLFDHLVEQLQGVQ